MEHTIKISPVIQSQTTSCAMGALEHRDKNASLELVIENLHWS
jgi:hypothetical protein